MDIMLGSDYENIRPLDAKGGMGDLFRAHKKGTIPREYISTRASYASPLYISGAI